MKIGIIGYGKMGKDIFSCLSEKLNDVEFVIIVRHNANDFADDIVKKLGKDIRRKKITQDQYDLKLKSFVFTDSFSLLSDCNMVIEAVSENLDLKRNIFSDVEKLVSHECILATNTSSLSIDKIFSDVLYKERCLGLHFFYPVKLSGFIEVNLLEYSGQTIKEHISIFAQSIGKSTVTFQKPYHFYLNQFILFCISKAFSLKEKYNLSVSNEIEILSEIFPIHGLLGMVDSIGLALLAQSESELPVKRISNDIEYAKSMMRKWLADGCSGEPLHWLDFMSEYESNLTFNDNFKAYKEQILLEITAAVLNEAVLAADDNQTNYSGIIFALSDVLGLAENMSYYYNLYGYDRISNTLRSTELYNCIATKSLYNKYLL